MLIKFSTILNNQLLAQFGDGALQPPSQNHSTGSNTTAGALTNLEGFFSSLVGVLTILGGLFFVVNFVIGAVNWITAGGESSKIEAARNKMIQSAIGLILLVTSYAIIGLLATIVGLPLLRPAELICNAVPTCTSSGSNNIFIPIAPTP